MTLATTNENNALSPLGRMAEARGITKKALLDTIMQTVVGKLNPTDAQLAAFLMVCDRYGLDPIRKEVYAMEARGGGLTPVVGVDGWAAIVARDPRVDGFTFTEDDGPDGTVRSVTCTMHIKGRAFPTAITEHLLECRRPTDPWKAMPRRMLRHKALIQCARVVLGMSGIYDPDEAEDIRAGGPPTPVGGVAARAREALARQEGASAPPADARQATDDIIDAELAASATGIAQDAPQADGRPEAAPSAPDAPGAVPAPATGAEKDTQELPGGWTRFRIAKIAGERKSTKGGVCLSVLTTDGEKFDFWSTRLHPVARAASESGVFVYGRIADKGVVEELSTEPPASGENLLTA